MSLRVLFLANCLFLASTSLFAQIYKCSEGGKTVFTDRPCSFKQETIKVQPAAGSGGSNDAELNNNSPAVQALKSANAQSEAERQNVARAQAEREAAQEALAKQTTSATPPPIMHYKNGSIRQPYSP